MALLKEIKEYYGDVELYIDGEFRKSESDYFMEVMNPALDKPIGRVPFATPEEVDEAVDAAVAAFERWRDVPVPNRVQYLFRMKEVLERHKEEIARIIVQNHGKHIDEARGEVRRAIENVEAAIGAAYTLAKGEALDQVAPSIDEYVIREPLGAFAIISPFNFPVMVPFWFMPYALAVGATVVIKPSEITPIPFYWVNKLLDEVGLPLGVVNVVYGRAEVGERLITHPDIQGVAFVGSTAVARKIYELAGRHGKRVLLQAGAKNYAVVMPDADMDRAATNLISSFFGNTGQRCLANAVLVPVGDAYERIVPRFVELAKGMKLGYGLDEDVDMTPLVSRKALERVHRYIEIGLEEGARLTLDGRNPVVDGYPDGYFVGPTIFEDVTPDMRIAQEEIFGPVASIIRAESLDEAIEMANSTIYGNASSIFTSSGRVAREFRRRIKAGNIGINVGIAAPMAFYPFAGMKESFFGVIHGQITSVHFFTDTKVVIERWW